MRVLILSDERYERLLSLWEGATRERLTEPLELPPPDELHELARTGGTPVAFEVARERMSATAYADDVLRARLHELIRACREAGIKTGPLVRWSGYTPRRVHQILYEQADPREALRAKSA